MKNISSKELNDLIANDKAIVIDVREPFEYQACHIKGSILIPSSSFDESKVPDFSGKTIVVHCKSGRRSANVISSMKNKNVYNLEGGIEAWAASGFNVVASGKKHLPLDRQVQLTIGIVLVLSFLLTFCINVNFVFIPFFVGCGLIFAALTGFCGLAIVLAKAPWNKVCNSASVTSCSIKTQK